jgi:RNA polymerase sigma factor (TIGR02999 family)
LRERLHLFTEVCAAIRNAHQKGIIHSDLKPSNILVSEQEGRPAPKVIDFGVAKAFAARLTERTLFTEQGRMIGTPEYMSPEQAEMSGLDVDIRTDVYSLGVLLDELLTGVVHEAYLRLVGGQRIEWQHRTHFFRVAAEAMRRVLVDHARRQRSDKRGGGRRGIPLTDLDVAEEQSSEEILALEDAMQTFEAEDPRAAGIVKLRYFAGLSLEETAQALGVSDRTVSREWAFARARLFELMEGGGRE